MPRHFGDVQQTLRQKPQDHASAKLSTKPETACDQAVLGEGVLRVVCNVHKLSGDGPVRALIDVRMRGALGVGCAYVVQILRISCAHLVRVLCAGLREPRRHQKIGRDLVSLSELRLDIAPRDVHPAADSACLHNRCFAATSLPWCDPS